MNKIKLDISGLSYSQTQTGAYALFLDEAGGKRQLPIIIGGFEAQAIAIELEKMTPSRPLTHDLFKNFAQSFSINVKEIIIYNLENGVFFSKLICEREGQITEIDSRTSDAIAIAVRFNCPIFTYEQILAVAGTLLDESSEKEEDKAIESEEESLLEGDIKGFNVKELENQLSEAIENEDYELASKIRDEINKRTS
jgi:bifunctional DNase/RNase